MILNLNNWQVVGEKIAAGNSNNINEYTFVDNKLNTGKYIYRLKMVDNDASFKYSDEIQATIEKPAATLLMQNYPNSFNPSTNIEYQLANRSRILLELYSITGELVATLVDQEQEAGYYLYHLDMNRLGSNLSSGVYIYRMIARDYETNQNYKQAKKMLFLK